MYKATNPLEFQSTFQQPISTNIVFADRIVEFGRKAESKNIFLQNDAFDFGHVFRSLDRYIMQIAIFESIKDLMKEGDAENISALVKSPEEQYKEIIYKASGLEDILNNLEFRENQQINENYDRNVAKLKLLLDAFSEVMSNTDLTSEKERQTISALTTSMTPIPGAPISYCKMLGTILMVVFVIILSIATAPRESSY